MHAKFNLSRNVFFLAILAVMCLLYHLYEIPLRNYSHTLMITWQQANMSDPNVVPWQISLADWLEQFTGTENYYLMCFMLWAFVSRPRFLYLLLGFVCCDVFKNIIKLGFKGPRPLWIFPDLNCIAAEKTLATPSGHTSRASFLTLFLLLDFFCASDYARRTNPETNKLTMKTNHIRAGLLITFGVCYFSLLAYLVFILGMHTIDQLALGLQFGVWMALYLHFCWRDLLYDHVSYLTNVPKLTYEKG